MPLTIGPVFYALTRAHVAFARTADEARAALPEANRETRLGSCPDDFPERAGFRLNRAYKAGTARTKLAPTKATYTAIWNLAKPTERPARPTTRRPARFPTDEQAEAFRQHAPAGDPADCWTWTGPTALGYGYIHKPPGETGLNRAHRIAYALAYGPIPPGRSVYHACDNRACVNPAHLHLGSPADILNHKPQN